MDELDQLDHYALLGVSRSATADEIKRAYRREIARYHPDRFVNASPEEQAEASRRAQRINEAYRVLSDFSSRMAYNRTLTPDTRDAPARTVVTPPPPQGRDHLAELYDQARAHLSAGRQLQAAATLREILAINPFYRDSAALLEQAEAARPTPRSASTPRPRQPNQGRRALLIGGIAGLLLAGASVTAWALRRQGAIAASSPTTPPTAAAAGGAAPTEAPAPTSTTAPTAAPTALPSATPTPTEAPAPTSTTAPTSPPTSTPPPSTATPAPLPEEGTLVYSESFSSGSGWPTIDGSSWSVGFASGAYRISAQQGVGNIWAFNTSPAGSNYQVAVDVEATGGLAGLLLRYSEGSYLAYFVDPAAGSFRLEQRNGGQLTVLAEEVHPAIATGPGAQNRLLARLDNEQLELRINGIPVANLTLASPPPTARYGLVVVARDAEVVGLFRNLTVWALS